MLNQVSDFNDGQPPTYSHAPTVSILSQIFDLKKQFFIKFVGKTDFFSHFWMVLINLSEAQEVRNPRGENPNHFFYSVDREVDLFVRFPYSAGLDFRPES